MLGNGGMPGKPGMLNLSLMHALRSLGRVREACDISTPLDPVC
jgi:hypothetical protein